MEKLLYEGSFTVVFLGLPYMGDVKDTKAVVTGDTVTITDGKVYESKAGFKFVIEDKSFSWAHKFVKKIYRPEKVLYSA